MIIKKSYRDWIEKHIGDGVNENSRFSLKISTTNGPNQIKVNVDVDLVWFILLQTNAGINVKLELSRALLANKPFLDNFNNTIRNKKANRLLAEFLIFNYPLLDGLKKFIDFSAFVSPVDIVSYAMLIKRRPGRETSETDIERLEVINAVLEGGFILPAKLPEDVEGAVMRRLLVMAETKDKFSVARKLIDSGFRLFTENNHYNQEIAEILIDARDDKDCIHLIAQHVPQLKKVTFSVVSNGDNGNIADFYYWAKEDMQAVKFLREKLGIAVTS